MDSFELYDALKSLDSAYQDLKARVGKPLSAEASLAEAKARRAIENADRYIERRRSHFSWGPGDIRPVSDAPKDEG